MRAIAALSVLVYHVAFRFYPPRTPLGQFLSQRSAGPPITAVVLFFLISGFVLYRPFAAARYDKGPPPALVPYAIRRFARIVPAYWVALAIVSLLLGLHYVFTPSGLVRYFGFLQLYGSNATAGGGIPVAWTLCVEITFYAAVPLLALAVRRLGSRRSVLGSELAMCAAMVLVALVWATIVCAAVADQNTWKLPLLSVLIGSLDFFAAGMALAVLSVDLARRRDRPAWLAVVDRAPWLPWLLGLGVLYGESRIPARIGYGAWWLSTHEGKLLGCALLLVPVVFGDARRGLLRRVLGSRPVLWLGAVSYGIYLWHYPLLVKLGPQLIGHGEIYTAAVLSLITIAVAALSYYLIERPAQRVARRYLERRAADARRITRGALFVPSAPVPPDPQA